MDKYGKIIAFFAALGWLIFVFAAFRGYQEWYAGSIFFFWLSLSALNYRRRTSLWFLKNRKSDFLLFYGQLFILSLFSDLVIGQRLTGFWNYPAYHSPADWLLLYFLLYPVGILAIIELTYFLSGIFGEELRFVSKPKTAAHRLVDRTDIVFIYAFYAIIFSSPLVFLVPADAGYYSAFLFWFMLGWPIVATLKLRYHITHWLHWVSIFITSSAVIATITEIPNEGAFEWRYHGLPALNQNVLGVPLGIVLGYYTLVMVALRLWLYFALKRKMD